MSVVVQKDRLLEWLDEEIEKERPLAATTLDIKEYERLRGRIIRDTLQYVHNHIAVGAFDEKLDR